MTAMRQIFGHLYLEKSPIFTSVCYCIVVGEVNVVWLRWKRLVSHVIKQDTCMYIHSSHASTVIGTLRRSYSGNPNIGARSGPMPVNAQHAYRGEAHPHGTDEAGRVSSSGWKRLLISLLLSTKTQGGKQPLYLPIVPLHSYNSSSLLQ